jgi:hypothetical protein
MARDLAPLFEAAAATFISAIRRKRVSASNKI